MWLRGVMLGLMLAVATCAPASAAPPPGTDVNQFYYTVTESHRGGPETLWEIADRFLGDERRAGEIFALNAGRLQADGDRMSDPGRLHMGWQLVLPSDAVGADLRYGQLPARAATDGARCERGAETWAPATWGQSLLAPSRVWPETTGSGIDVALVGPGVDGSSPALAGRVTAGADIASDTGRGDTECAGGGTALAGLIAGDDGNGGTNFGVAPGARIVPVKTTGNRTETDIAASAITVAAASGAQVMMIAARINPDDPAVRAAVDAAITRDVLVVVPASIGIDPMDGMLRVGAVNGDRQPIEDYPAGSVDVLAPGVEVATIGGAVTGEESAAALVAGTAALVRAMHPRLPAATVFARLRTTATARLVSPADAVTSPLPAGVGVNADPVSTPSGLRTTSRVLTWLGILMAVALLVVFVIQGPARVAARGLERRRARRRALAARSRLPGEDDDDPFWDGPVMQDDQGGGSGEATMAIRWRR